MTSVANVARVSRSHRVFSRASFLATFALVLTGSCSAERELYRDVGVDAKDIVSNCSWIVSAVEVGPKIGGVGVEVVGICDAYKIALGQAAE